MKNELEISVIQSKIICKNKSANLKCFDKQISEIKSSDIILLPEMFNSGFYPKEKKLAEKMDGETVNWMLQKSIKNKCSIAGTLMILEGTKIYNRLVWVNNKQEIFFYDKVHLFSMGKEDKHINKGNKRLIIEDYGWKICPLICYDIRFPVFSRNNVNYDILVYLANWPIARIEAWDILLKARAIENQCFTFGVNRVGIDNNHVKYNGSSAAYNYSGKKILSTTRNTVCVNSVKIYKSEIETYRKKMNFLNDMEEYRLTSVQG